MEVKYPLYLIRRYHKMLLGYANRTVQMKRMLQRSKFMPFLWKYEVAQMITEGRQTMKELAQTIATLRKDYSCVDY